MILDISRRGFNLFFILVVIVLLQNSTPLFAAPNLTTSVYGDYTVSGTTNFSEDLSILSDKSLLVTGTITQGTNPVMRITGHKGPLIPIANTDTITTLTINLTTLVGGSLGVDLLLFGVDQSDNNVTYKGSFFYNIGGEGSSIVTVYEFSDGKTFGATQSSDGNTIYVDLTLLGNPGDVVYNAHLFYEVTGAKIMSIE